MKTRQAAVRKLISNAACFKLMVACSNYVILSFFWDKTKRGTNDCEIIALKTRQAAVWKLIFNEHVLHNYVILIRIRNAVVFGTYEYEVTWKLIVYNCYIHVLLPLCTSVMEGLRHRGRLKAPNISISPHPHEVACVLNTMAGILAASDNIIRRDKVCICLLWSVSVCSLTLLSRKKTHVYLYPR